MSYPDRKVGSQTSAGKLKLESKVWNHTAIRGTIRCSSTPSLSLPYPSLSLTPIQSGPIKQFPIKKKEYEMNNNNTL